MVAQPVHQIACNTFHDAQQRCARCLLSTHHSMHHEDLNLSHDCLASMLGVQHSTLSVAAMLQDVGFIRYAPGRLTVRDRKGPEDASCECHEFIRHRFDWLDGRFVPATTVIRRAVGDTSDVVASALLCRDIDGPDPRASVALVRDRQGEVSCSAALARRNRVSSF